MKRSVHFLTVIATFGLPAHGQVDEPLKLIQSIPLPGLHDSTFDHFQVDLPGQRLFVAAEDNHAVEVIDMRSNQLIHTIPVPNTPHSMGYDVDLKKLLVADERQVEIYDGTTYKLLETIPTGAHADASVYDPVNKLFYVGNGGRQAKKDYCLISIIDARTNKVVGEIKVDSDHIEGMAVEKAGHACSCIYTRRTP